MRRSFAWLTLYAATLGIMTTGRHPQTTNAFPQRTSDSRAPMARAPNENSSEEFGAIMHCVQTRSLPVEKCWAGYQRYKGANGASDLVEVISMLQETASLITPTNNHRSQIQQRLPFGIGRRRQSTDVTRQDTEPPGKDSPKDAEVQSQVAGLHKDQLVKKELFKFCELYGWGCGIEEPETALFPDHEKAATEPSLQEKTKVQHQAIALNYLARSLHEHVTRACSQGELRSDGGDDGGGVGDGDSRDAEAESHLVSTLARKKALSVLSGRAGCVSKHMLHVFCVVTQDESPLCGRTIHEPGSEIGKQVSMWPATFRLNTFVAQSLLVRAVPHNDGTPMVLLKGEGGSATLPGWSREPVTNVTGLGFRGAWLRVVIPGEAEAWARYQSDDHSIPYLIREGDTAPNYPRRFIVNGKSVHKPLPLLAHPYVGAPPSAMTELRPWEVVLGLQRLGRWLRVVRFVPPLIDRKRDGNAKSTAEFPTLDSRTIAWAQMRAGTAGTVQLYPYPLPNGYCANDRNILCDADLKIDQICNPTKFTSQSFCRRAGHCAGNDRIGCSRESDCGNDAPCIVNNLAGGRCHLNSDSVCVEDADCLGEDNLSTGPCVKKGVCNHDLTKECEGDKDCSGPSPDGSAEEQGERQCIFGRCARLPTMACDNEHDCGTYGNCVFGRVCSNDNSRRARDEQGCDRTRKPPALEGVCTGDANAVCGAEEDCNGFGKCLLGRRCQDSGESCQSDKHCPNGGHCLAHGHCGSSSTACNDNDDCGEGDCIPAKGDQDRPDKVQNDDSGSRNNKRKEREHEDDENGDSETDDDEHDDSDSSDGNGQGSKPSSASGAASASGGKTDDSKSGLSRTEGSTGNKVLDAELEKPILQVPGGSLGKDLLPGVEATLNTQINKFVAQVPDSLLDRVPGLDGKMDKSTATCLAKKCVPLMKESPPKLNDMPPCLLCCIFKVCIETGPAAKLLSALRSVGRASKPDVVQSILEKMGAAAANGGTGGARDALRNAAAGNAAALIAVATGAAGGGGVGKPSRVATAPHINHVAKSRLAKIRRLTLQAAVEAKAKIEAEKEIEEEETSGDAAETSDSRPRDDKTRGITSEEGAGNPGGLVGRDSRATMPSEAVPTGAAVTVDGLECTVLGYFAEDDTFEIREEVTGEVKRVQRLSVRLRTDHKFNVGDLVWYHPKNEHTTRPPTDRIPQMAYIIDGRCAAIFSKGECDLLSRNSFQLDSTLTACTGNCAPPGCYLSSNRIYWNDINNGMCSRTKICMCKIANEIDRDTGLSQHDSRALDATVLGLHSDGTYDVQLDENKTVLENVNELQLSLRGTAHTAHEGGSGSGSGWNINAKINEHRGNKPSHREIVHEIKKLSERDKGRIGVESGVSVAHLQPLSDAYPSLSSFTDPAGHGVIDNARFETQHRERKSRENRQQLLRRTGF